MRQKMAWSDPIAWLLNAAIACGEDRLELAPDSRTKTRVMPCEDSRPPPTATDHTGLRTDVATR
jgi:hypothetical protein